MSWNLLVVNTKFFSKIHWSYTSFRNETDSMGWEKMWAKHVKYTPGSSVITSRWEISFMQNNPLNFEEKISWERRKTDTKRRSVWVKTKKEKKNMMHTHLLFIDLEISRTLANNKRFVYTYWMWVNSWER